MSEDPGFWEAFFVLHSDLPREGPGLPEDVAWAASTAGIGPAAEMADVGCGPGADIAALLAAAPQGHVTALDKTAQFVEAARARYGSDDRVTVLQADMARIQNRHDLIWSAGSIYFMGVTPALTAWRKALRPGGAVAFSTACWFTDTPSDRARAVFAEEPAALSDEAGLLAEVAAAGYEVLASRRLTDAAWEAYYTPMEARIAALRAGADEMLTQVLDQAEEEIVAWRACREEFGYLLCVVRPK